MRKEQHRAAVVESSKVRHIVKKEKSRSLVNTGQVLLISRIACYLKYRNYLKDIHICKIKKSLDQDLAESTPT